MERAGQGPVPLETFVNPIRGPLPLERLAASAQQDLFLTGPVLSNGVYFFWLVAEQLIDEFPICLKSALVNLVFYHFLLLLSMKFLTRRRERFILMKIFSIFD